MLESAIADLVYSTIVMDFLTPFYPSVKALKKAYPEYRRLKVVRTPLRGRVNENGDLEITMTVYRVTPGGRPLTDIPISSNDSEDEERSGDLDRYIK